MTARTHRRRPVRRDIRVAKDGAAHLAAHMRRLFGADCIRTIRSHSKYMAIRNENWSIAVRTSMNLNQNPRCENLEISDDPALCGFLEQVADDIFGEQEAGRFTNDIPLLASIPGIERAGRVSNIGAVRI